LVFIKIVFSFLTVVFSSLYILTFRSSYAEFFLSSLWYNTSNQNINLTRAYNARVLFSALSTFGVQSVASLGGRCSHFITNWILSTNHRRIAVMYFIFTVITGFSGLILATIIRIELAYAGQGILCGNAEKYLTIISLHGVVMVFFVVIPILFGAFGNFLLPTQLGIRDVAFPRLNSFMF